MNPTEESRVHIRFEPPVAFTAPATIAMSRVTASAGKRGTGSWAPTMVREVLLRERYIGWIQWGKAAKTYRGGTKVRLESATEDRIRAERPESTSRLLGKRGRRRPEA